MAYSTPALVRKAITPTSDGSEPDPLPAVPRTAADLSDAQLSDAIAEADSTIDGYIGNFYTVPVAAAGDPPAVPSPLPYWSRTIAAYLAVNAVRGELDMDDANPVLRRYKDVLAALEAVSAGTMKLQIPDNTSDNAGSGAGAPFNPYVGDLFTPEDFGVTEYGRSNTWWEPSFGSEF